MDSSQDKPFSPLFIAAANGHLTIVQALTARGYDLSEPDGQGNTPLMQACQNGQINVAMHLVSGRITEIYGII